MAIESMDQLVQVLKADCPESSTAAAAAYWLERYHSALLKIIECDPRDELRAIAAIKIARKAIPGGGGNDQ